MAQTKSIMHPSGGNLTRACGFQNELWNNKREKYEIIKNL